MPDQKVYRDFISRVRDPDQTIEMPLEMDDQGYHDLLKQLVSEADKWGIDEDLMAGVLLVEDPDYWLGKPDKKPVEVGSKTEQVTCSGPDQSWQKTCELLSVALLEKALDRDASGSASPVVASGHIPPRFINQVIQAILEQIYDARDDEKPLTYAFIELIRYQLRLPAGMHPTQQKSHARQLAALILSGKPRGSDRTVAQALGVDPSSLRNWRKEPEFQKLMALYATENTGTLVKKLMSSKD